ncbi:MAG: 16S rRNA (uracil(1498)-N(3))-methyltransferase [Flavobacteriales bacterium]|nr:16S rRNA (uracil(1498)-N(3))-methyltransferase [Flavobacteriales bacterium]
MHLFHCPDLDTDLVQLPEEEAHHATSVLRLGQGVRVGLLNGRGMRVEAELEHVGRREVTARVVERISVPLERKHRIHLAVAPTKQMERYEWFVEKAVEIGVDRITPLVTARTERAKLRIDRLDRVAISAMKQSQRAWLPTIDELTPLADLLKRELPAQRYFGWCEGEHTSLMQYYSGNADVLVLVGPEGDFTNTEADLLREHRSAAVSLGAARLRTETAALAACTWMSLAQQR